MCKKWGLLNAAPVRLLRIKMHLPPNRKKWLTNVKKGHFLASNTRVLFSNLCSTYKWFEKGGTYFWVKSFSISKEAFVNGITPCWRANIKQLLQNRKSLSNLWSIKVNFATRVEHTIFEKRTLKVELEKNIIHDVENIALRVICGFYEGVIKWKYFLQ